jgi:MFS family permease
MCLGFFIAFLDVQIVASSLREIGGGLSASQDEISWVQTSYLVAEIVVIPLSGWLSRVMSTRWLFAASAAGFTVTSLLCGFAWDIQSMIVFRALQGFLGGSMIPTVFTTAFFFYQRKQVVIAAAIIGGLASLAPTLGPVIGGWITETWSWHWPFYINLVPGVVVTVLVPLLVKIDKPDLSLLKGGRLPRYRADGGVPRLSRICARGEAAMGLVWLRYDQDLRMDFRHRRYRLCRTQPDLYPTGRRSARPRHPQLLARLLVLLCHWHWHLWHGLSDANLPGPGPRLRCVADRHCPC